jgi:GT2 family glycosyltransferase
VAEQPPPAVTITLATWNGMRWLQACLASIAAQSLPDYELLIRDDASTDATPEFLAREAERDERIRFAAATENAGYGRTQNALLRQARGEAVLVLNQDVVLDPGFLEAGVRLLERRPRVGSVQGRILRLGNASERLPVVDTTGLVMKRDRRVVSRDQLGRASESRPPGPVWGADGPAALYRRSALEDVRQPDLRGGWEVLDSDFHDQKEDADLAWRLRRLGWEAWYEPAMLAWHARTGADSAAGWRANLANPLDTRVRAWRNQRLMQLKNDDPGRVLRDLPWILARELGQLSLMLLADQRRLRALPGLLRLAPAALRKRRAAARKGARRGRAT